MNFNTSNTRLLFEPTKYYHYFTVKKVPLLLSYKFVFVNSNMSYSMFCVWEYCNDNIIRAEIYGVCFKSCDLMTIARSIFTTGLPAAPTRTSNYEFLEHPIVVSSAGCFKEIDIQLCRRSIF